MLLETNRLVILTLAEPKFDEIENDVEPFLAIDNDNIASIAVAKKCGFKRIAGSSTQGRYYVV